MSKHLLTHHNSIMNWTPNQNPTWLKQGWHKTNWLLNGYKSKTLSFLDRSWIKNRWRKYKKNDKLVEMMLRQQHDEFDRCHWVKQGVVKKIHVHHALMLLSKRLKCRSVVCHQIVLIYISNQEPGTLLWLPISNQITDILLHSNQTCNIKFLQHKP